MRLFILVFFSTLLFISSACKAQQKVAVAPPPPPPPPVEEAPAPKSTTTFVEWDKTFIELGAVKKGETRSMEFTFTNSSTEDVKIDIVDACTCTTVEYPRRPIPPGGKAKLEVVFDSTEKDASETIEVRIIFANMNQYGIPRIETISYHFDLVK